MKKLIITMFIFVSSIGLYSQQQEVKDLIEPPYKYLGIWKVLVASNDCGKTVIQGNFETICKLTATKVFRVDGETYTIKRIGQIVEQNKLYTSILFEELPDVMWVISDVEPSKIMMQTFDIPSNREVFRAVIFIMK